MKIGIFAKTFAGSTPLEVLTAAQQAGYASVQYNMACSGIGSLPVEISDEVVEAIAAAAKATGVEIAAVSATYNMIHPDLAVREAGRNSFAAIAAAAQRMGTRLLTVCTGSCDAADQWRFHPDNAGVEAWAQMVAEFRLLLAIADRYDLTICVEPELANVISNAERARELIDSMGSDRIRIVLDPANLVETESAEDKKQIIADAVTLLAKDIVMAHAKDRNADASFATAGKGVIDFTHYLGALSAAGFSGHLITHGLAADEAAGVSAFLKQTLATVGQPS